MSARDFAKRCLFTALRIGFRLTPMPGATRDRLRQRFLDRHAGLLPQGPRGQSVEASQAEHRPRSQAAGRAIGFAPRRNGTLPTPLPATVVAFYLPQFHPIPENDAWWGEGFTEWHNVTRALPQFEGHAQPRLPGELGFYDLRLADTMRRQMQLAREYGIGTFCSYFYWFAGKTLLETPLQQWLADSTLDLPLCLCWANENWSRRWDGRADDILIGQRHSPADDLAFIEHVARYLADPRYLRVDGKPLLLVYRPGLLPDPKATAALWREWCRANGLGEIHLAYVQSFDRVDPRTIGFDAAVEFPPNNTTPAPITARQRLLNPDYRGDVHDWRELARQSMAQPDPAYPRYPGVNPGWDNEPRRSGSGRVFAHASPRGYRDWLRHAIGVARRRFPAQPLVFVNAWNEWAEGAVLEPDSRLGHAWLEATRAALQPAPAPDHRPCAVLHVWYPELLDELVAALHASGLDWRIVITTAPERERAVRERIARLGIDAEVEVFENRGRDILPFLHVANRLLDEGVTTVLKLHGKRSTHRQDGDIWRRELLEKLLAPERATRIATAFRDEATQGLVHAEGHRQPLSEYIGANKDGVDYLIRRLGIPAPRAERVNFIAGSMFWLRPAALRPLLDAHLGVDEFEPESGQIDGTLAHAVERVLGLAAQAEGYRVASAAALIGLDEAAKAPPYPYARRSC
ncbi:MULTISPECIES: glycoside hydrolase family 99-like domain-containing protein [unclassified Rhodanobacter]|uniref:Glycoside hydrolase family 99-like domain-containing protein n=1 Tax=Rhodanobacter humi TaxID=1888173 RepID=A0ABV4AUN1_9GAMM